MNYSSISWNTKIVLLKDDPLCWIYILEFNSTQKAKFSHVIYSQSVGTIMISDENGGRY